MALVWGVTSTLQPQRGNIRVPLGSGLVTLFSHDESNYSTAAYELGRNSIPTPSARIHYSGSRRPLPAPRSPSTHIRSHRPSSQISCPTFRASRSPSVRSPKPLYRIPTAFTSSIDFSISVVIDAYRSSVSSQIAPRTPETRRRRKHCKSRWVFNDASYFLFVSLNGNSHNRVPPKRVPTRGTAASTSEFVSSLWPDLRRTLASCSSRNVDRGTRRWQSQRGHRRFWSRQIDHNLTDDHRTRRLKCLRNEAMI